MESGVRFLEDNLKTLASKDIPIRMLTKGLEWNYRLTKQHNEELKRYSDSWVSNKIIKKALKNLNNINEKQLHKGNITEMYKPRGVQIEALYELKKRRIS